MRSTLEELTKELEELKALVSSIGPVNAALAGNQDSHVKQYMTIRRRFDYAAFVVGLYASFEKFIENLVASYATLLARRLPYTDLPEQLARKHVRETAVLLSRKELGNGRYAGISELNVVKNLFGCLSGAMPYTLNKPAVVAHSANLRSEEINKLFGTVGIENVCERVRSADALREWYSDSSELNSAPQDRVRAAAIEERLKDIIERRNEVAHRGGNPDDLWGVDNMADAISFITAFSQSVFAMTVAEYLRDHYSLTKQGILLQQRSKGGPIKNGTVVLVEKPPQKIFVGQPVFVLAPAIGARWGRIQSMQVDGTEVESVDPDGTSANGVGLGLNFKCPKSVQLFALASDDEMVWSAEEKDEVSAA